MLVESRASETQLQQTGLVSWEHGLTRNRQTRNPLSAIPHLLVARGEADAPDIDGRVFVRGRLPIGQFAQVRVVGHADYDLIAEPVESAR